MHEPIDVEAAPRRSMRQRFLNLRYPDKQYAYRANMTMPIDDPIMYEATVNNPTYGEQWEQAVQEELPSLACRCTWELVLASAFPRGKKLVGCRWVFKVKYHLNSLPKRFKARLVAQGLSQRPGIDYNKTFLPTLRYDLLRVLITLAAVYDLKLHQMDVVSTYLAGELDEEVYMRVPSGLHAPGKICLFQKSIYGLKQSGRIWNKTLVSKLNELGFCEIPSDSCIFYHKNLRVLLAFYVNDILLIAPLLKNVQKVKLALGAAFETNDLGEAQVMLGLEISCDRARRCLTVYQSANIHTILW